MYSLAAVCLAPLGYQPPVSAGLEPGWQGAGQLVLSVLLPAVAEEAIFRKEILGRLLGAGERPALLASAVLFALLHGDAAQAASALAAGLVLGLVALRWGAGWAAAVHLANNLLALLGTGVWPAAALLVLGLPGLYKLVRHPRWLPRAGARAGGSSPTIPLWPRLWRPLCCCSGCNGWGCDKKEEKPDRL